ncbi:phage tail protein [Psychrobacter sp. KCTC 72983]|uniref:phage tail protein n=1 Tax=Psychrobacter sp. KCTC 72983 TaxID=2733866 RepID=UPI0016482628|nr:phage tail protein [Psychrobacter sp. KCTC 72983]
MKYLQQLKDDLLTNFAAKITADKVHLFLVNGELPSNKGDINYIARFLFIDCRDNDPFSLITYIRKWFESKGYPVPDLNFDCEVIDAETYDLTIDIGLMDKLVISEDGSYHQCPPKVWSEALGDFVTKDIADAVGL